MNSSRTLPGFESPGAGFDEPFEMLAACHERVRRTLALLERLQEYLLSHPADAQARSAAADVLRYFSIAAPAHHEDEERHVVPALQADGAQGLAAIAARLLEDHARIRLLWARLAPQLEGIVQGRIPAREEFGADITAFVDVHHAHLALEDELAFPGARRIHADRGAEALEAMGREMASRRQARA